MQQSVSLKPLLDHHHIAYPAVFASFYVTKPLAGCGRQQQQHALSSLPPAAAGAHHRSRTQQKQATPTILEPVAVPLHAQQLTHTPTYMSVLCCITLISFLQAVEGSSSVRSPGYHQLLQELITEAERNAHKPQQRLIFMGCLGRLLPCIGLYVLRHTAALMPLLLEWSHAYDEASAVAAVRLLGCAVQHAWPRIGVHAGMIWRHLVEVVRGAEERRWLEVGRTESGAKGAAAGPAKDHPHDAAETAGRGAEQHTGVAVEGFEDSVLVGAVLDVASLLVRCGAEEFSAAVAATTAVELDEAAALGGEGGGCSWVRMLLTRVRLMTCV
jgi:hypothetical protein